MSKRLWILGAADPEMVMIERMLLDCEEDVGYAAMADGSRVHPGNMYRATGVQDRDGHRIDLDGFDTIYKVECGFTDVIVCLSIQVEVIDHHRPGDAGYGMAPEKFLPASSIGQVFIELVSLGLIPSSGLHDEGYSAPGSVYCWRGQWRVDTEYGSVDVPRDITLAAAADHCLGAAYRGECPGIAPDELRNWRAGQRAAQQGKTTAEILARVEAARHLIRDTVDLASWVDLRNWITVVQDCGAVEHEIVDTESILAERYLGEDIRSHRKGCPTGAHCSGYEIHPCVLELPEAACIEGIGVLAGPLPTPDGRRKYTLMGADAETVRAFLNGEIAPELVDRYGDPARGFAGGHEQ